jgi:DNA-binding GntR family transcriptional regulator
MVVWNRWQGTASASEAVHGTLRDAIVNGQLRHGVRLAEEELSQIFGISRTPVREALLRLESERLAERVHPRRLVVRQISPEEIMEVYLVSQHLAALAGRLAAPRVTPIEIAELRWLNEQLRDAVAAQDIERIRRLDTEFHHCTYKASGNSVVVSLMQQLHDRVRRFPGSTFTFGDRMHEVVAEHDALIDALAAHDADRAAEIAEEHHARALRVRMAMLETQGGDGGSEHADSTQ